jgi:hypothetical protein
LEKVKISFSYLETADTLWLIRFFRKTIPLERQCDWNMFAFKVANRLRDRDELENRPLSHDEVLITRQRWNGLFALFIPVLAVAGVYVYQQTGKLGPLFAPLGLIPFWILIRLMVPANGMRSKRLSAQPDAWYLYFLFASLALPIIEIILSKTVWPQINNSIAMWVTAFVWFVALIVATFLLERQVRRRECNESALAADKWDMGEAAAHDD